MHFEYGDQYHQQRCFFSSGSGPCDSDHFNMPLLRSSKVFSWVKQTNKQNVSHCTCFIEKTSSWRSLGFGKLPVCLSSSVLMTGFTADFPSTKLQINHNYIQMDQAPLL
jgi:hypothetical protein